MDALPIVASSLLVLIAFGPLVLAFALDTRANIVAERRLRVWLRQRASHRDEMQARREIERQVSEHYNLKMRCHDRQVIAFR